MSTIDSNNIGICKTCGALVWWERIKDHDAWHEFWESDPPTEAVVDARRTEEE